MSISIKRTIKLSFLRLTIVDYITELIVNHLVDLVHKKNKNGNQVQPHQIKSYMWVFINCQIENPTFDSQTKENMTLQVQKFASVCKMND